MADASDLFSAMSAYTPEGWDWGEESPARAWLDAICEGFVSMWTVGATGVGIPPFVGAPWAHTHLVTTLDSNTMLSPMSALSYTVAAEAFFSGLCTATSAYLITNSVISIDTDGSVPHTHILPGPKAFTSFGTAVGLKAALLAAISVTGDGVVPVMTAISGGIIDFLTTYATLVVGAGPAHTHGLLC